MEEIRTDINKHTVVFPMTEWPTSLSPCPPPPPHIILSAAGHSIVKSFFLKIGEWVLLSAVKTLKITEDKEMNELLHHSIEKR